MQNHLRAIEACLNLGDLPGAVKRAGEAAAQGFEDARLLTLAAYDALNTSAVPQAVRYAKRACELAPTSVDALNVLGLSLVRAGRIRDAMQAYDNALRIAPRMAHVVFNRAVALEQMGNSVAARDAFLATLAIDSRHADSLAHLANLSALAGRTGEAREFADRALALDPRQYSAHLAIAAAEFEDGNYDAVLAQLARLLDSGQLTPTNRAIAFGQMADALHGLGRYGEAFADYLKCNDILREMHRPVYEAPGIETALQRAQRLLRYFEQKPNFLTRAPAAAAASPVKTHVFLVGFPRSGTTLLEQILASHFDIETMEERDLLIDASNDFILPAGGLDTLAALKQEGLEKYRQRYWQRASEFGFQGKRSVFVDKMPLNSVLLCLVAKLFPDARVLLVIRDPRDVVLSCFRRRFVMNAQMYQLLSLHGAATYYDAVMRLVSHYREKLHLALHVLRYEDMVRDFDSETGKLCAFLEIPWHEEMKLFAVGVRERGITTPSAAQVARGLFPQGIGQWKNYGRELSSVMPVLAPWVANFGYEAG